MSPKNGADPRGAAAREAQRRATPHAHITLVRHGEPDWTPAQGPSVNDPHLTPFGADQARATAHRLAAYDIDAIYVSPYRRAQETAAPLAEATGLTPVVIDGLAEVGVAVDGLSQEEVDRYFIEGSQRPLSEHWEGWPGAETFHEFHERVTGAVTDILARHDCRPEKSHDFTVWHIPPSTPNIVLVAHGGTNSVALAHLLDVRPVPWEWVRFESELAAYSVVHARPIGPAGCVWSLQNFNETEALRSKGLR